MALSKDSLKDRIIAEFQKKGADAGNQHSWFNEFAEAIAAAIVDEMQANAKTDVKSGSSAGSWPIQ